MYHIWLTKRSFLSSRQVHAKQISMYQKLLDGCLSHLDSLHPVNSWALPLLKSMLPQDKTHPEVLHLRQGNLGSTGHDFQTAQDSLWKTRQNPKSQLGSHRVQLTPELMHFTTSSFERWKEPVWHDIRWPSSKHRRILRNLTFHQVPAVSLPHVAGRICSGCKRPILQKVSRQPVELLSR